MYIAVISLIIGFVLLIWSANKFIDGAAATAVHFGMSPLAVGMLIVGFGTSAPEILVSIAAAIDGAPILALGIVFFPLFRIYDVPKYAFEKRYRKVT